VSGTESRFQRFYGIAGLAQKTVDNNTLSAYLTHAQEMVQIIFRLFPLLLILYGKFIRTVKCNLPIDMDHVRREGNYVELMDQLMNLIEEERHNRHISFDSYVGEPTFSPTPEFTSYPSFSPTSDTTERP